jgi:hypothetical protein
LKISGTAPLVDETTDYTFYVQSAWTDIRSFNVQKAITIQVVNVEVVEDEETDDTDESDENNETDETDETDVSDEVTTTGTNAATSTRVTLAFIAGFTLVSSIISKSSTSAMWSFVNQLQMITLLMQVDPFTPEDFIDYLERINFVNGNFQFIPFRDVPIVNWPANVLDTKLDDAKLNASAIHSQSTFVNLYSTIFVLLIAFSIHVLLLMLPNAESRTT